MTSILRSKRSVTDVWPITGKKVLVRVDFNVPIKNGEIKNDFRLRAALPTIKSVIDDGGICILMSHLGRPKGVKFAELQDSEDLKRRELQTWALECGTGKTTFFALLSAAEKLDVLRSSSKAAAAETLSAEKGSGKTQLFTTLPEAEKRALLDAFTDKMRQEVQFPQLRQYQGFEEELSLQPVAERLEKLLEQPVVFAPDCLGADDLVSQLKAGDVMLLENVRFYSDEGSKDEAERLAMAAKIASYGDCFVSDAFGTAHRDSATMTGIPKVLGHGAAGLQMGKEIDYFAKILDSPPRPMIAIVGGAKVSDKIMLLEHMMGRIDKLVIGGAMAYTFLKAQGVRIGKSYCEAGQSFTDKYGEKRDIVELAANLLAKAKALKVEVILPVDHTCHTECAATPKPLVTLDANVPDDMMALDVGPKSIEKFVATIKHCKAAIWNGPVGVFEIPAFSKGTYAIAKAMAEQTHKGELLSIVGGGDSAAVADHLGVRKQLSHISSGGNATLELLEGKVLPGIAALDDK
jgi:phosphoglycerate kinase